MIDNIFWGEHHGCYAWINILRTRYHPRIKRLEGSTLKWRNHVDGALCVVGDGGGREKVPISEVSLNIPAPTLTKDYLVSSTKGTFDPTLDPRYRV
jgi:hypothetical protein